jgi:hypothetical protein
MPPKAAAPAPVAWEKDFSKIASDHLEGKVRISKKNLIGLWSFV